MARTMSIDNTDIYRTVVEMKPPGRNVLTCVYGPYDSKFSNKDYTDSEWGTANASRRITKQKLEALDDGRGGAELAWLSYSVTYKNGGEGVNWNDQ